MIPPDRNRHISQLEVLGDTKMTMKTAETEVRDGGADQSFILSGILEAEMGIELGAQMDTLKNGSELLVQVSRKWTAGHADVKMVL